jgi:hypothetical protein
MTTINYFFNLLLAKENNPQPADWRVLARSMFMPRLCADIR